MKPSFKIALEHVLRHEGGLADNKNDPGGITAYGISLRWLEAQGIDLDGDGDSDRDDILFLYKNRDLTATLYHDHFWLPVYDAFPEHRVAAKLFDMAVNMGHSRAHKLMQRACNRVGAKLVVDGDLGPASFGAIERLDSKSLVQALCDVQAEFYQDLVKRKPKMGEFLRGWLRRAKWAGE